MTAPPSLPARRGRVFIARAGSFHAEHEVLRDHTQMPQFMPRTEWPEDPDEGLEHRPAEGWQVPELYLDWPLGAQTLFDGHVMNEVRAGVLTGYPALQPMPPYSPIPGGPEHRYAASLKRSSGALWSDHVAVCHGLLHHTIPQGATLRNCEMDHLIAIVTYGMKDSVAWEHRAWIIHGPNIEPPDLQSERPFQKTWDARLGMELATVRNNRLINRGVRFPCRQNMAGRRWLIVPIQQRGRGWSMTIFDRQQHQLYIFDPSPVARDHRIEAIVHAWTQFWNDVGFGVHFQYFVPEVWVPPGNEDTGLLSIHWLIMMLRNQVGERMMAHDTRIQTNDISIRPEADAWFALTDSSLPACNWAPRFLTGLQSARGEVYRVIKVILCNELGLSNHPVMNQTPDARRHNQGGQTPLDRLNAAQPSVQEGADGAAPGFFTAEGGTQWVYPRQRNLRDFNANAPRRHLPTPGQVYWNTVRPELMAGQNEPDFNGLRWPPSRRFRRGSPLRLDMHLFTHRVSHMRPEVATVEDQIRHPISRAFGVMIQSRKLDWRPLNVNMNPVHGGFHDSLTLPGIVESHGVAFNDLNQLEYVVSIYLGTNHQGPHDGYFICAFPLSRNDLLLIQEHPFPEGTPQMVPRVAPEQQIPPPPESVSSVSYVDDNSDDDSDDDNDDDGNGDSDNDSDGTGGGGDGDGNPPADGHHAPAPVHGLVGFGLGPNGMPNLGPAAGDNDGSSGSSSSSSSSGGSNVSSDGIPSNASATSRDTRRSSSAGANGPWNANSMGGSSSPGNGPGNSPGNGPENEQGNGPEVGQGSGPNELVSGQVNGSGLAAERAAMVRDTLTLTSTKYSGNSLKRRRDPQEMNKSQESQEIRSLAIGPSPKRRRHQSLRRDVARNLPRT